MRDHLKSIILYTIAIAQIILVSCNKGDDSTPAESEPEADYTIIYYGCGGGNLDEYLDLNFQEVEAMGYQEDVQFTAMYKYSTSWQELGEEAYEGTRLLTMEASGEMSNTKVGEADLRLDDPQNLANFIIDAKLRLPAKKYILILTNHGSGFDIRDQLVEASYATKAVCFDDNNDDASLSIFELDAALDLVGEKFDMLYWNACFMTAIENTYQIYDHFDYILGSNFPAYPADFSILINGLMKYDNIVESSQYYTEQLVDVWRRDAPDCSADLALMQCDKVERVVELIGDACDILCEHRDSLVEGSEEDFIYKYFNGDSSEAAKEYYFSDVDYGDWPYFFYTEYGVHDYYDVGSLAIDLYGSLKLLGFYCGNAKLTTLATLFHDAVDDMYLCRESYLLPSATLTETSISITWISDVGYKFDYPSELNITITSFEELYPNLAFDKATGWGSRFLAGNVMQAVGYNAESEEYYVIERE